MWPSDYPPDGGVRFRDQGACHGIRHTEPNQELTPALNICRFKKPRHLRKAAHDPRIRAGGQHRRSAAMISVVVSDDDLLDIVEVEAVGDQQRSQLPQRPGLERSGSRTVTGRSSST